MYAALEAYVRFIDRLNWLVGHVVMYAGMAALVGVLIYSTIAGPMFDLYPIWTVEMAQFVMSAYYLLGGGYSVLDDSQVRMDVFYMHWSTRTRAIVDASTDVLAILYVTVLMYGGWSSIEYAFKYSEHAASPWAPAMLPVKSVMCVGILLMLLQLLSTLIKDVMTACGRALK